MTSWRSQCPDLVHDEEAASSIEYAFLASLIALVIIVSVEAIGVSLIGVFTDLLDAF